MTAITDQFKITDVAASQLVNLLKSENNADVLGVRIFINGSGCSGIQYGMTFADTTEESDGIMDVSDDLKLYVDAQCLESLQNVEIDFADSPQGASFVFNNTAQESGCGTCPSSVASGGGCG